MLLRLLLSLGLLLTLLPSAHAQGQGQGQRVLLLLSYEPLYPTAQAIIQNTTQALRQQWASDFELNVEYLDADVGASPAYLEQYAQLLKLKQQRRAFDAVLVAGDAALSFAAQHQEKLFTKAPIVFLNVHDTQATQILTEQHALSGVMSVPPIYELLDLLLKLYPHAKDIHLIDDGQSQRRGLYNLVVQACKSRHLNPITHSLTQRTWQELADDLHEIKQAPIILISAFYDYQGRSLRSEDANTFLSARSGSPIWHLWHAGIGQGLAGGVISDLKASTELAVQMLQKKSADNQAQDEIIWQPPLITLIDETQINRFGFTSADFPENSVFIVTTP